MIYLECGVHHAQKLAFFNCNDETGRQIATFLVDFNTDEKRTFANAPDESEIQDISPCGTQVLTIDRTYEKRKRKTKIFDLKTKELRFETTAFFGYEAWFSSVTNLLLVRADVKGKSGDKLFVFDTQKSEIVHFMQGNHPLTYGGEDAEKSVFAYPNSRKKDEVILLDLTTLQEKIINLGSKKLIHRVMPLGGDEFFAIDGDYFGFKFNGKGEILWKTAKIDWEEFYYAPTFFIFENQVVFERNIGERINLATGEFIHNDQPLTGTLRPFFDNWAINNQGEMCHLQTGEIKNLDIKKYVMI